MVNGVVSPCILNVITTSLQLVSVTSSSPVTVILYPMHRMCGPSHSWSGDHSEQNVCLAESRTPVACDRSSSRLTLDPSLPPYFYVTVYSAYLENTETSYEIMPCCWCCVAVVDEMTFLKFRVYFFFLWLCGPTPVMASSFLMFLDHTKRHITVRRTPLDE